VERPAEEAVAAEVEEAATATGAPGPGNAALARLGDQAAAAAASGVLSNAAAVRALAGTSGDREQAADRVADAVTGPFEVASGPVGGAVAGRAPGARGGDPLPSAERAFFEPRLGVDLGGVRVHGDADAAGQAGVLHARAFTVGADIYLGRGEPGPGTATGRHLLAHELAHVVQQRGGLALQRQEIPGELESTLDYRSATDGALRQRHDRIVQVLAQFDRSTPETALLEQQVADIGTELARRAALAAGRTFSDADVERARAYFVRNAQNEKDSCIVALNKGLKLVTGDAALPTTAHSIEATMAKVVASGHAEEAEEIWFRARNGHVTRGSVRPDRLDKSVWDAVLKAADGDPGWSVFTMSLLDGYHSVTLTLDASDPGKPHVYWSDQWHSKGGWKEYTRADLDDEVTKLCQSWWDEQPEDKKANTVVRLWRIRAKAPADHP